ncbi:MAG: arginine deiminase family protein [Actinomycetota bacterium]|nr:arginine deiminase family protein [Actinomycetota bacterium]
MSDYGVRSMVAPLTRVAVRAPSLRGDYAVAHWALPINGDLLLQQHRDFVALLSKLGCEVEELEPVDDMPDACFVFDPAFVIPSGVIELRAAKAVRAGEPALLTADLHALGVPVVGKLTGVATADGGDMCWIDENTLAIGRSYRTNTEAIEQMRPMLAGDGIAVEVFDVPHDLGPEFCLHLLSVISPVRADLAVVYERLAPVALLQALQQRGVEILSLPEADYPTLGCNVLVISPGVVVMTTGNDATAELLRQRGVEVHLYEASEINKGEGGPTCLTRPIKR